LWVSAACIDSSFVCNLRVLILVYSPYNTSHRLQYVLHEIFTGRLGISYQLTGNRHEADAHPGPLINYSHEELPHGLHIKPHPLITETGITSHSIQVTYNRDWDSIFFEQQGDVPFDMFSATFYLLSRYEEYLPHMVDDHGRFDHEQSLAVQNRFIETPLADKWALQLKTTLENTFGPIAATTPAFRCITTIDIDIAYLYKGISPRRQILKFGKSSLFLRFGKAARQMKVHMGRQQDPYDTYEYIHQVTKHAGLQYFILSGGHTEFDQPLPVHGKEMRNLLQSLSHKNIGLHPSYASSDKEALIGKEKHQLEQATGKAVIASRQHFLRFRLPATMHALIQQGIRHEYSMGYSGIVGFRASTAHPFRFFDLEQNTATELMLYPSCVMDVTLRYNMGLTIHAAQARVEQLMQEVKQVNGLFITIWHNSNLSSTDGWLPWREVFEKIHTLAARK
jgi:hypothetical protein